eukprot:NODE_3600_length_948_cov_15.323693_g3309_i0.p1 GENE.NODE_3600_length_948_cov_15.323693_g3309_i0~~NODE_3600_length_948_cov_15.323693_g3309_i0.p1  ORF type:complete len:249 (+),score=39.44 NODE_3600_length_948_cov_15.323693_g3309_i0:92-838(+)
MPFEGYWGPVTSNVDWCEHNYVYTPYVAEFWNTLSSFPISFIALYGLIWSIYYKHELRVSLCFFFVIIVGLGSAAFHATLKSAAQALDELPMIYGGCVFLFTLLSKPQDSSVALATLFTCYCAAFTVLYILFPSLFAVFIVSYVAAVGYLIWESVRLIMLPSATREQRLLAGFALAMYSFGFLIWNIENVFCPHVEWMQLHAWFHLLSNAPYLWVVFIASERARRRSIRSHVVALPFPHCVLDLEHQL